MDKKINILYDASLIFETFDSKKANRSGLFFTALNILKEFICSEKINISLYSDNPSLYKKWNSLKKELEKDVCCENVHLVKHNFYDKLSYTFNELKIKKTNAEINNKCISIIKYKIKADIYGLLLKLFNNKKLNDFHCNIDAFFSPVYATPQIINEFNHIKKYIILYDTVQLIFPEYYEVMKNANKWFLQLVNNLNKNDSYFAISQATKQDFLEHCSILTDKQITVTPLACADYFVSSKGLTQKSLDKYNLPTNKKYVFSLCTLEPRKNLIRAVKTFIDFIDKNNIDDMVFILGGGAWKGFIEKLETEVGNFDKYKNKILRAGYIDDEDLAPLYSGAEWFVYTSQYEGFGLPLLEAMSCGCPVITSNNSSIPEVVDNAGIMIDFDSDEQHIAAYEKYYFDNEFRNIMTQKGYEHSKTFSWKKCADIMIGEMTK
ncbi:MAG: glycosyltransferase family 1 protein [Candidatus Gastranaerophilales bacterium]